MIKIVQGVRPLNQHFEAVLYCLFTCFYTYCFIWAHFARKHEKRQKRMKKHTSTREWDAHDPFAGRNIQQILPEK